MSVDEKTPPSLLAMTLEDFKRKRGYNPDTGTYSNDTDPPDRSGASLHNIS